MPRTKERFVPSLAATAGQSYGKSSSRACRGGERPRQSLTLSAQRFTQTALARRRYRTVSRQGLAAPGSSEKKFSIFLARVSASDLIPREMDGVSFIAESYVACVTLWLVAKGAAVIWESFSTIAEQE